MIALSPVAEVVHILKTNKITGVDAINIHAFLIPQNDWDLKPILQVNEITNYPDTFGNNEVIDNDLAIQVQVYYPADYSDDMTATETSIKSAMKSNGYRIYDNGVHTKTPDGNILITIKFNIKKEQE